ncbi:hypothetical protein SDC9_203766 [bioreactor metagenome]|uniref:Uncharacterized protein n=1 Tax=bioreactor metagenome TaxID=1076179 RepID=A0A645IYV7_9ZZZZ
MFLSVVVIDLVGKQILRRYRFLIDPHHHGLQLCGVHLTVVPHQKHLMNAAWQNEKIGLCVIRKLLQ